MLNLTNIQKRLLFLPSLIRMWERPDMELVIQ